MCRWYRNTIRRVTEAMCVCVPQGVRGKAVQEEANRMIEDLQLQDKRDTPSSNLSGGMKRKLR